MSERASAGSIWILSAYAALSHRVWARTLMARLPEQDWHLFELPGRHFKWRIRGNPLTWLDQLPVDPPECIVATSMVDLATLKGLRPDLMAVPTLYYFHENQFAYPVSPQQVKSVEPQMVQLYGALAADQLAFNSDYNRRTFLDGVAGLLDRLPDGIPDGVSARLQQNSGVLPVPVDAIAPAPAPGRTSGAPLILWNHRWEYDKAPQRFCDAMLRLAAAGVDFRLALLGPRPREAPPALRTLREHLAGRILADGKVPTTAYQALLAESQVVVSTADHEFQGLAMLEAVSAGARPLVPDALCYVEQYPDRYRYPPADIDSLVERLQRWLQGNDLPPPVNVSRWTGEHLVQDWRSELALLCRGSRLSTASSR